MIVILFKCQICGCEFGVREKYVKHNKNSHKYISCPAHGKHSNIHVVGFKEIKRMMEERKGVLL